MDIFTTHRHESINTKVFRQLMNLFPSYRRGGGRVSFISGDWQEIHVKLSLNWATRNYVGTVFGGSIYAALDPIYMLQFIKILGKNYVVWDKSATIKFIRPIKRTVFAKFEISDELVQEVIKQVHLHGKYILELPAILQDKSGTVYASATKEIYIASREYYKNRKNPQA